MVVKFWEKQIERANKVKETRLLVQHKSLTSDFHIAHPNVTKVEIHKMVMDESQKRIDRIERKQKRHRKK